MKDTNEYWVDRGKGYLQEFKNHNPITRYRFWRQERAIRGTMPKDVKNVLEIGCGYGRITKILLENHAIENITAIDISPSQIKNAKDLIKDPRVVFHVMSVEDLNYVKEFDLVIAAEVLMHIPPNRIKDVIGRMFRTSRKYVMNIDWYAPGEPLEAGGYCWQHPYLMLYLGLSRDYVFKHAELAKKIWRQGIFIARV